MLWQQFLKIFSPYIISQHIWVSFLHELKIQNWFPTPSFYTSKMPKFCCPLLIHDLPLPFSVFPCSLSLSLSLFDCWYATYLCPFQSFLLPQSISFSIWLLICDLPLPFSVFPVPSVYLFLYLTADMWLTFALLSFSCSLSLSLSLFDCWYATYLCPFQSFLFPQSISFSIWLLICDLPLPF